MRHFRQFARLQRQTRGTADLSNWTPYNFVYTYTQKYGHRLRSVAVSQKSAGTRDLVRDSARFLATGHIRNRLYVLVFTPRGDFIHVISLRKANTRELQRHEEATRKQGINQQS